MQITVKPNTYIHLVILLFLVPFPWLTAWLISVIFHEFCHWAAVKLCRGEIYHITVGLGGAVIESSMLAEGKRLFAILSGPLGGFALVLIGRWFPRVALCSWVLSVYNLLPLLPLDGGSALQILLRDRLGFYVIERVFLIIIIAGAVYIAFCLNLGILPLAIAGGLWLKNRKTPCKKGIYRVQ